MGLKIFINESEKNRIRFLYENKSLPPNESEIVVEKKNPFKYQEYINARKEYSPNLKNGDMFYVSNGLQVPSTFYSVFLSQYVPNRDSKFYYNLFKDIFKDFMGKTVRLVDNDQIINIKKFDVNVADSSINVFGGLPNNPVSLLDLRINKNGNVKTKEGLRDLRNLTDEEKQKHLNLINYSLKLLDELQKKVEYFSNIENFKEIPDEYFDIYRIKRQETDF